MLGALSIQRLKTATTKNKNKGDWGVHSSFHCGISKSNSNPFILHLSSARSTRTRRLRSRSMRRRWWHRLIAPSRNLTTLLPSPLSWRNLELVISTTRLPVHIWRYVQNQREIGTTFGCLIKADSMFAPNQWETALLCNDVSYWLAASLESPLLIFAYTRLPNPVPTALGCDFSSPQKLWRLTIIWLL